MSYTVYGLRSKDSVECRYIGFTKHEPDVRLRGHLSKGCYRGPFKDWIDANRGQIEAFAIAKFDTEIEARAGEKAIIALCLRLGQRLFNSDHVPSHLRIAA